MARKWHKGDRCVYSGPVVNESWPVERQGTIVGVHGDRIDILWDGGGTNYSHEAHLFTRVTTLVEEVQEHAATREKSEAEKRWAGECQIDLWNKS